MKAVILLSGGIDSTVLLADRINAGDNCYPLTFDYGQTHQREVAAARDVANHYNIMFTDVIKLPKIFADSALTGNLPIPSEHADTPDATTVPARNLVMLAVGAAIAERIGAAAVMFGANADDAAGYLDCRHKFIQALDDAVNIGTSHGIAIRAPYLSCSKTEIVKRGRTLNAPLHLTYSCYRGDREPCGRCGACQVREAAMA